MSGGVVQLGRAPQRSRGKPNPDSANSPDGWNPRGYHSRSREEDAGSNPATSNGLASQTAGSLGGGPPNNLATSFTTSATSKNWPTYFSQTPEGNTNTSTEGGC